MSQPQFNIDPKSGGQAAGYPPPGDYSGAPSKSHGCFFYGCITVLVVSGLGLLVIVGGLAMLYSYVNRKIEQYTETAPAPIPVVTATEAQQKDVKNRWDAFKKAIDEGKETELVLTADDINLLLDQEPFWKKKVYVSIKGEEVTAQVSFPLSDLKIPVFNTKGRFLNGNATITAEVDEHGHLDVRLKEMEVKGKKLDPEVKAQLGGKNLAENASDNPDNQKLIRKIRSIKIKDGKVYLKTRSRDEEAADRAAKAGEVETKVLELIRDAKADPALKVTRETSFRKDLDVEPDDMTELTQSVEEEFEITIPPADVKKFETVGQLIDYVQAKVKGEAGAKDTPKEKKKEAPRDKEPEKEKPKEPEKVKAAATKGAWHAPRGWRAAA